MDIEKSTNDEKIERYKSNDEIDLVDILAVIIKRKWTIIILIVISFVLSLAYVKLYKGKSISFSANLNITLPEEYTINTNYILSKKDSDVTFFIDKINQEFSQYKNENKGLTELSINLNKTSINVVISANNKNDVYKTSLYIYGLYKNYKNKIFKKNKNLYEIAQNSLDQKLNQKQAIINMLMENLNKSSSLNKNHETNGAIVYVIDFLSNDVSNIERIKALNQEVLLKEGKIEISDGANQLILNDSTISNIKNYIKPKTPSRKKTLLPIIVSVFLALFVGIFLAFVIEFFSREDVKKRLREASKR